jgi:hypothetical protein
VGSKLPPPRALSKQGREAVGGGESRDVEPDESKEVKRRRRIEDCEEVDVMINTVRYAKLLNHSSVSNVWAVRLGGRFFFFSLVLVDVMK